MVANFFQVQIFKLMTSFTSEWSRGGDVGCVWHAWLLSLPSLYRKQLRNRRRTRKAHLRYRHNSCWLQNGLKYVLRSQGYLHINSPQHLCQCVGPQHLRREDSFQTHFQGMRSIWGTVILTLESTHDAAMQSIFPHIRPGLQRSLRFLQGLEKAQLFCS